MKTTVKSHKRTRKGSGKSSAVKTHSRRTKKNSPPLPFAQFQQNAKDYLMHDAIEERGKREQIRALAGSRGDFSGRYSSEAKKLSKAFAGRRREKS